MKTKKEFTAEQVDAMIRLKFGQLVVSNFNTAYTTDAKLAKLFKVSATKIRSLMQARFAKLREEKVTSAPRRRQRYGIKFVSEAMNDYIVSETTLLEQAGLSLVERCLQINRLHPFPPLNPTLLRRIYRRIGVKKKAINYNKFCKPGMEEQLPQLMKNQKKLLDDAKAEGRQILYIDETMFTRKAIKKLEWARKHENAEVDEKLLNDRTYALLMGISEERGVEQWKIFPKSVNTDKFLQYLDLVR